MLTTKRATLCRLGRILILTALLSVAGCGLQTQAEPRAKTATSEQLPVELQEILAGENTYVEGGTFETGLSADEALAALSKFYKMDSFQEQPTVYAVTVTRSDQTRLRPGSAVRIVHIPGVPQSNAGPAAPRTDDKPVSVDAQDVGTDMFAFVDAVSGEFLLTTYAWPNPK